MKARPVAAAMIVFGAPQLAHATHTSISHGGHSCVEVSEVVGLQQCSRFGRWDVTHAVPVVFDLGGSFRYLPISDGRFTVGASSPAAMPMTFSGLAFGNGAAASVFTFDLRVAARFAKHVRVGLDSSLGATTPSTQPSFGGLYGSIGGLLGASFDVGAFTIDADLVGGARMLGVSARFFTAEGGNAMDVRMFGEARATLGYRITPYVSIALYAGLAYAGNVGFTSGVALRFHTRAFDGRRDP